MAKPTIVTRAGKGSALTWTEGDANLTNLRDATIGITDGTTSGTLDLNDTLTFTAGTNVTLSYNATSKALTINASSGSSTPTQASLSSATGSYAYFVGADSSGTGTQTLVSINSYLSFDTINNDLRLNGNFKTILGGGLKMQDYAGNYYYTVKAPNSGMTADRSFVLPAGAGSSGQALTTDGSGNLSWTTITSGATNLDGLSDVVITTPATGNVLRYNGTNFVNVAETTLSVSSASTATTATNANNINISTSNGNANDTTLYPVLVGTSATGNQLPHIDGGTLTYNASTGALSATSFTGTTSGNHSGTVSNTLDTTTATAQYPLFASASGTSATTKSDTGLTYVASTGTLTSANFSGSLSGTVSSTGIIQSTGSIQANSTTSNIPFQTTSSAMARAAWTTLGANLRLQARTYTDTSTAAGTLAASYINVAGAPALASTNAITITDAANWYIAAPTASTNSTITNAWAILSNGNIKAAAFTGSGSGLTNIPNSALTNSAITINGTSTSLGGTISVGTVTSVAALTLGTSGTDVSSTVATGTTTPVITLNIPTASATNRGALSAADWTTFNSKGTGTVTSVAGTGTVNGLTLTGTVTTTGSLTLGGTLSLVSPPAIGSTTPNTGAFTTLSATTTGTSGALNVTYNPASASGSAIQATGKDSQGGVGYFDFLKATNTTTGVTNGNKTIRLNSTGALEIINSAYSSTIFSLTDAGTLALSGTLTAGGTTLPSSTGTNGQVLTANGSGGSTWTTPSSGGGASVAVLNGTITSQTLTIPQASFTNLPATWSEAFDSNNIVTVSTDSFTLGTSGTYLIEYSNQTSVNCSYTPSSTDATTLPNFSIQLYNSTTSTEITRFVTDKIIAHSINATAQRHNYGVVNFSKIVTTTGSNTFVIRYITAAGSNLASSTLNYINSGFGSLIKITKLA